MYYLKINGQYLSASFIVKFRFSLNCDDAVKFETKEAALEFAKVNFVGAAVIEHVAFKRTDALYKTLLKLAPQEEFKVVMESIKTWLDEQDDVSSASAHFAGKSMAPLLGGELGIQAAAVGCLACSLCDPLAYSVAVEATRFLESENGRVN